MVLEIELILLLKPNLWLFLWYGWTS